MQASSLNNPRVAAPSGTILVARRLVWNVLPALMVLGAVKMTLLGDQGMFNRHQVKRRLHATEMKVEQARVENAEISARIRHLRMDQQFVKRVAAERLLVAEPGATLYRFSGPIR
jgi:cell division protein FtsB